MNLTVNLSSILGGAAERKLERTDPQMVLLLGLCTLGVYPLYKFYRIGLQYEALAGRASNVQKLLGIYLGSHLLGVFTLQFLIGFPILLGSVLAGLLALNEVLALRREVMERHGIQLQLHEPDGQRACWVAASLLSWIGIGVVPAAVQCWWFFSDQAALAEAMQQRPEREQAA